MDNRIFGLDPQLLFDTAIGLLAMLVLFILLSYLLFNPARKLIQKRKEFIASQLEEAAKAEKDAKELETQYRAKLDKVEDEAEEMLSDARKKALDKEPQSAACLDSVGWVYYKLGLKKDAAKYLLQAYALRPENAEIIEHLKIAQVEVS